MKVACMFMLILILLVFEIDIPDKFIGRTLNIFEKSNNVNVMSKTSNAKILIDVSSSNPMYGYVVMKI